MTTRTRILTGITTTGTPHLGNYAGAIRPAILASQDANADSFYFLTDYQKFDPGDVVHVRAVVGGTEVHFDLSILVSNSTTVTCLSSASLA